jgi:hypothetical protein
VGRINADLTGYVLLGEQWRTMNPTYNWAGDSIVYDLSAWGFAELWRMNPDGSGQTMLLSETFGGGTHVKQAFGWSPDGTRILYSRYVTAGSPVYAFLGFINPDGSDHQVLSMAGDNMLSNTSNLLGPPEGSGHDLMGRNQCWSSDGEQIVFMSNRDGNWEIYLMDSTGAEQTRLTSTAAAAETNPLFIEVAAPPLAIACPADMVTVTDAGQCSARVEFFVTAAGGSGEVTVVSSPASGSEFAKGVTTVLCTATDETGNEAECSFTITVLDDEPPTISGLTASPSLDFHGIGNG